MTPDVCAQCGAEIPPNAKACPGCGADENTGWSEESESGGLDLPEEDFDYEEFVKREFGGGKNPVPHGIKWYWWLVALLLVTALLSLILLNR